MRQLTLPSVSFWSAFFVSATILSACPFVAGWYWALVIWWTELAVKNCRSSLEQRALPLFVHTTDGIPNVANRRRGTSMTAKEVAAGIARTSNYLVYASTTIRNILPSTGPAKSMWIVFHYCCGRFHSGFATAGGVRVWNWHLSQDLTHDSTDLSRFDHDGYEMATSTLFHSCYHRMIRMMQLHSSRLSSLGYDHARSPQNTTPVLWEFCSLLSKRRKRGWPLYDVVSPFCNPL